MNLLRIRCLSPQNSGGNSHKNQKKEGGPKENKGKRTTGNGNFDNDDKPGKGKQNANSVG